MSDAQTQRDRAEIFRALHHGDRMLILPNAWDVPSARVFEDAGFPAVATSSAALAASLGYPDGERVPKPKLMAVVRKMAATVGVPLSVDLESGYGATVADLEGTIRGVVRAGAVGINLEDALPPDGEVLRPLDGQLVRLRAARRAAGSLGVPIVINARTDAYTVGHDSAPARLDEAVRRARAFEAAGADCLYPMGLTDRESIRAFVRAVRKPVNVMVRRGLPPVKELEEIGVKRLSLGPYPLYAAMGFLKEAADELRRRGSYDTLLAHAITFDELMSLAVPRRP